MAAKVSQGLLEQFAGNVDPDHREAVVMTVESGTEREALEGAGIKVTFVSRDERIVAGSIDAVALERATGLPGVLTIEADGEVRALS
jgi:hypothetical protein